MGISTTTQWGSLMVTHPLGERPMTKPRGHRRSLFGLAGGDFDRDIKELFDGDTRVENNGDLLGDTKGSQQRLVGAERRRFRPWHTGALRRQHADDTDGWAKPKGQPDGCLNSDTSCFPMSTRRERPLPMYAQQYAEGALLPEWGFNGDALANSSSMSTLGEIHRVIRCNEWGHGARWLLEANDGHSLSLNIICCQQLPYVICCISCHT